MNLSEAIQACLDSKARSNRRPRYLAELRRRLESLHRSLGPLPLAAITPEHLERWTAQASASNASTMISRASTLFSWAVRRRIMESNPALLLDRITIERPPPSILSVNQCRVALDYTQEHRPAMLPTLCAAMFYGIRPAECLGLRWEDVDSEGRIWIRSEVSKVRRRRIVNPPGTSRAWIAHARSLGGRLGVPLITWRRHVRELARVLCLPGWPQDVLRHSCASYWLAHVRDAAHVALELGNSVPVLLSHYRLAVTPDDAAAFWSIAPDSPRQLQLFG